MRVQELSDPVEVLLHGFGKGLPISAAERRIAQREHHPLSRLAFRVAAGLVPTQSIQPMASLQINDL